MPKLLRLNRGTEESLIDFLRFLLESRRVKGVFCLKEVDESGGVAYSLVTDPAALEGAQPLFPLMPVDAAKVLSSLTLVEPAAYPIAAVVRPCELRALTELIKRNQGSLDSLLIISSTCGGVYPLETAVDGKIPEQLPQYWEAVKKGEMASDIRLACVGCEHFVPYNADMTFALVGNSGMDEQCVIQLNTDAAEQFAEGFTGELTEAVFEEGEIDRLRGEKRDKKQKLFDESGIEGFDIQRGFNTQKIFEKCIGCRNCSKVCPVCYCRVCYFDSGGDEHDPAYYETEMEKKGYAPVLPDSTFYQLVRLFHVSISCIGCGLCSDVCPVDIPLWAVSLRTGEAVQKAFDYVPGRNLEEAIPLFTFELGEVAGAAQ